MATLFTASSHQMPAVVAAAVADPVIIQDLRASGDVLFAPM
jgi:hypothetical protein